MGMNENHKNKKIPFLLPMADDRVRKRLPFSEACKEMLGELI